jgi:hypothetical protein
VQSSKLPQKIFRARSNKAESSTTSSHEIQC